MITRQPENFLLSIIIPTRNRQEYASQAVEQVLSIPSDKIQLVIQDNSDDEALRKMIVKYQDDKRLKYNYTSKVIPVVENCNAAVSLADGEYLFMIGDDDGVIPDALPLTKWLKDNNIDACALVNTPVYIWPSSKEIVKGARNGYLLVAYVSDKVSVCDAKSALKKIMSNGGQKYLTADVAKLYHGIVKKSCLVTIKNITGHYIGGLSADIYAAVALSLVADKVVKINYPITVAGICEKSVSADSAAGRAQGKLEDALHFRGRASYDWSDEVPAFYSSETIWADSVLQALKELGANDYTHMFNVSAICMYCLRRYPQFKDVIIKHCKKYKVSKLDMFCEYISLPLIDLSKRATRRLLRKKNDVAKEYNIKNIETASKKIVEQLDRRNITISNVLHNLDQKIK